MKTDKELLAEATALLRQSQDGDTTTEGWRRRRDAFLSATPAQAAEPDTETAQEYCERLYPTAQAAEPGHDSESGVGPVQEHPDTIALRECRAELEHAYDAVAGQQLALESARAERDTALQKVEKMCRDYGAMMVERDTALRGIENERKAGDALQKSRDNWRRTATARQEELDTALTRIAELEAAREQHGDLVEPTRSLQDYDTLQGLSDAMLRRLVEHPFIALARWASHELRLRHPRKGGQ